MSQEIATLAGGCFWCMVKPFDSFDGVNQVVSGYAGGHVENPTYEQVGSGKTGHTEAVQIHFDNEKMTYKELLNIYFKTFDPTDKDGQFGDRGTMYEPVIFYHSNQQKEIAEQVKDSIDQSGVFNKPIITPIKPYKNFYPAEDYHQEFYKKESSHYNQFYKGSGRKQFIESHWN
ncbi:peptide-methionine (S)-S-oxide reductase MsrA [Abyssicoccus albus]|uniref:peptide-methionine (S)-S-oxide reductase MsrA n=1 Tax=Abyssicoccus albus TaxID=1817405 RepID=UPI00097E29F7|nr:peptide-methionine (S)-S-oxide reductase MsrA [Abyssicoccus albus]AQL56196.1 peptide-methionine (S)-S-oxide reductase [Abyssicoccus albus]